MSDFIPLCEWMLLQPSRCVATDKGQYLSSKEFVARVNFWTQILSEQKGKHWAVFESDSYEFLAILLALWHLDKIACIPGDNCQSTIKNLKQRVAGFIGDFPDALLTPQSNIKKLPKNTSWPRLNRSNIALEIYTSGSSGEPDAITKSLEQLENELKCLNSQWPSQNNAVILSTVSHQHFYGMIFRLFWPFCVGQAFERFSAEYSEDIFHLGQHYAAFILVSSPSHLSRMNPVLNWPKISSHCQVIYSSAAPLARTDSLGVSQILNAPVREIYGSSETGVIAWRTQSQDQGEIPWQPLPKVKVFLNKQGQASINSTFLSSRAAQLLNDRLTIGDNGHFTLNGRIDKIVKVEGKRVSLQAIETLLNKHDWIEDTRALTINRKRVETAVVIILTKLGKSQLMLTGRKKLVQILKASLAVDFENIVLPRRWRFVNIMPINQQGKIPLGNLLELIEQPPLIEWPTINSVTEEGETIALTCSIPPNLAYFDGHFDSDPILAGVVQVHWADKYAQHFFAITSGFKKLEQIKFTNIIRPNQKITLNLEFNELKRRVSFNYRSDKGVHSSGRICFE